MLLYIWIKNTAKKWLAENAQNMWITLKPICFAGTLFCLLVRNMQILTMSR